MTAEDVRWLAERGHLVLLDRVLVLVRAREGSQALQVAHGPVVWVPLATIAAVIFPEAPR